MTKTIGILWPSLKGRKIGEEVKKMKELQPCTEGINKSFPPSFALHFHSSILLLTQFVSFIFLCYHDFFYLVITVWIKIWFPFTKLFSFSFTYVFLACGFDRSFFFQTLALSLSFSDFLSPGALLHADVTQSLDINYICGGFCLLSHVWYSPISLYNDVKIMRSFVFPSHIYSGYYHAGRSCTFTWDASVKTGPCEGFTSRVVSTYSLASTWTDLNVNQHPGPVEFVRNIHALKPCRGLKRIPPCNIRVNNLLHLGRTVVSESCLVFPLLTCNICPLSFSYCLLTGRYQFYAPH